MGGRNHETFLTLRFELRIHISMFQFKHEIFNFESFIFECNVMVYLCNTLINDHILIKTSMSISYPQSATLLANPSIHPGHVVILDSNFTSI